MAIFNYKTKDNSNPKDKPRVYFTCHPDDFDLYFEKIVSDIFETHDCAVYYTPDMTEIIEEENISTDLGRMNLFVVPVTAKLLTTKNRAMSIDISYAKQEKINIIPFMMEKGLDAFYSKENAFGSIQYLSPFSSDITEIRYAEKLKRHLNSVLLGDKLAKRVRAAFDAYIFLSYRKKDRRYANELMRLIHKNPECRDIAIWFDEFLTPGENFYDGINKAMETSKLFSLLVTPNLLEESSGRPNFVMAYEYPEAIKAGKDIFPVEMQTTDRKKLEEKFLQIPACAKPDEEEAFREQLLQSIKRFAVSVNNNDPEHKFLIGLAYLEGIDVEIDRTRGFELILSAAEDGLPEAMKHLVKMYRTGQYIPKNNTKAIFWLKELISYYEQNSYSESPEIVSALTELGDIYYDIKTNSNDNFYKALECYERAYRIHAKIHEGPSDTAVEILRNISETYRFIDKEKSIEPAEKAYDILLQMYEPESEPVYDSLLYLAYVCEFAEKHDRTEEILEHCHKISVSLFGKFNRETIVATAKLALAYENSGKLEKAKKFYETAYNKNINYNADEHILSANILNNFAYLYEKYGEHEKAAQMLEDSYWHARKDYPDFCFNLKTKYYRPTVDFFKKYGLLERCIEFLEKCYEDIANNEGYDTEYAVMTLMDSVSIYRQGGQYSQAVNVLEYLYKLIDETPEQQRSVKFSAYSSITLVETLIKVYQEWKKPEYALFYTEKRTILANSIIYIDKNPFDNPFSKLQSHYKHYGSRNKALEILEAEYDPKRCTHGNMDANNLTILSELAMAYMAQKNYSKLKPYLTDIVNLYRAYLGENHALTTKYKKILSDISLPADQFAKENNTQTHFSEAKDNLPDSIEELQNILESTRDLSEESKIKIREKLYQLICQKDGELSDSAIKELHELAHAHLRLKNYSLAADLFEKVHFLSQKTLGEDYHVAFEIHTNWVLDNLSKSYMLCNNLTKLEETTKTWYDYVCKYKKADHYSRTNAILRLADVYFAHGEYDKSEKLLKEEYRKIISANNEANNYASERLLRELVKTYKKSRNYSQIIEFGEKLCEIYMNSHEGENDTTVALLSDMAYAHYELGNHEKAHELQKKCYELRVKNLGDEDPKSIVALNNLAMTYSYLGDYKTTAELMEKVCEKAFKVLGESHKRTLIYIRSLAYTYFDLEDYSKALQTANKAYELYSDKYGAEDSNTIEILKISAGCYKRLNDYENSKKAFELLYDLLAKTQGEDHPDTLKIIEVLKEIEALKNDCPKQD